MASGQQAIESRRSAHVSESVSRVPIPCDGLHQLISKEHNDAIPLIFDDHGRRRGLECRGIAIQPHAARKQQLIAVSIWGQILLLAWPSFPLHLLVAAEARTEHARC